MDETVGDVEEALMNAEAGPSSTTWPTAPTYDWTNRPTLDGQLQVAELESEVSANFFRSARWCVRYTHCVINVFMLIRRA